MIKHMAALLRNPLYILLLLCFWVGGDQYRAHYPNDSIPAEWWLGLVYYFGALFGKLGFQANVLVMLVNGFKMPVAYHLFHPEVEKVFVVCNKNGRELIEIDAPIHEALPEIERIQKRHPTYRFHDSDSPIHAPMTSATRLRCLGDVILLGFRGKEYLASVGDVLIVFAAVCYLIVIIGLHI